MKRLLLGVLLALLLVPVPSFAAYQAIGKAEDAAHSDGDYGVMSLCVRKDTSTTGIGANGDYVPCAVNASGYVYTTADVTAVVPGTGASSLGKAEDAAHGSGDTGVFVMGRRIDTAAASSGTSGDYEAFNMDSSGRLWVNPGVIGIEDAAETAGGNLAMIGSVRRDTAASSAGATGDNATLNTDATGRLWSNTEMPDAAAISADDQSAPTAPATYAFLMCFDGSAWDRCIGSGNYVEDAASAGAEQVILSGGVRQDTLASNTSADGDYTYNKYTSAGRLYTSATVDAALPAGTNNIGDVDAIQSGTWTVQPGNTANTTPWLTTIHQGGNAAVVNGSGQLSVTCANCSGSGASFVDDAAFTVGTSSGAPAMGMLDEITPDTVNEGDVGVVRMSANRNLYVQLRDNAGNERGLNIDASGNLTANITGTTADAILTSTNFAAAFGTAGSADTQVMSVQGIASMTPIQVQSNSGNLLLESTFTSTLIAEDVAVGNAQVGIALMATRKDTPANTSGTDGDAETLQMSGGRLWVSSSVTAIAAGDNNIGNVDIVTMPNVTIGTFPDNEPFNVAQIGGTSIVTGGASGLVGVGGNVAHDAADSANPVKIGGKAVAHGSNPTGVAAADRTDWYFNRAGIPFVIGGHPNVISVSAQIQDADGAQTDAAIASVSGGTKIVVTRLTASCDGSTTGPTNIKVGFGATTLPASAHTGVAGILHEFDGVPAGGGFTIGDGSGILGIGADGEDLRITTEDPAGGNCTVTASYYTIES